MVGRLCDIFGVPGRFQVGEGSAIPSSAAACETFLVDLGPNTRLVIWFPEVAGDQFLRRVVW